MKSERSWIKKERRVFAKGVPAMKRMLALALLLSGPALGAEENKPSAFERAIRSGHEASQWQDWESALSEFEQAHKLAPWNPMVMLLLAVTHDRAGNELPAICWYRAYLAAAPNAPDSQRILKRVPVLEAAANQKAEKLKALAHSALLAADRREWFYEESGPHGQPASRTILWYMVLCGRMNDRKTAESLFMKLEPDRQDYLKAALAIGLARGNHFEGASQAAGSISGESVRWHAYIGILICLLEVNGDTDAALNLANNLKWENSKLKKEFTWQLYTRLAIIHARRGELKLARAYVKLIPSLGSGEANPLSPLSRPLEQVQLLTKLGSTLAMAGDLETAQSIAEELDDMSIHEQDDETSAILARVAAWKALLLRNILKEAALDENSDLLQYIPPSITTPDLDADLSKAAAVHARCGNIETAKRVLDLVRRGLRFGQSKQQLTEARDAIASYCVASTRVGDVTEAMRIAGYVTDPDERARLLGKIAGAKIEAGDLTGAIVMLKSPPNDEMFREIVQAKAAKGDFDGAFDLIERLRDDTAKSKGYRAIAIAQAARDDYATAEKTAGMITDEETRLTTQAVLAAAQVESLDATVIDGIANAVWKRNEIRHKFDSWYDGLRVPVAGTMMKRPPRVIEQFLSDEPQFDELATLLAWMSRTYSSGASWSRGKTDDEISDLAFLLARRGQYPSAKYAAWHIVDEVIAARCYARIAAIQHEQGEIMAAQETIRGVLNLLGGDRSDVYVAIAEELAEVGDIIGLSRTAQRMLRNVPYRNERVSFWRVAHLQRTNGDDVGADATLKAAKGLRVTVPVVRAALSREQYEWVLMAHRWDIIGASVSLAQPEGKEPITVLTTLCRKMKDYLDGLEVLSENSARRVRQYREKSIAFCSVGDYERAVGELRSAIKVAPRSSLVHKSLARLLANCPDDKYRDAKQALDHAKTAYESVNREEHSYLAALAAAYAAAGEYDSAIEWQRKACDLIPLFGFSTLRDEYRNTLDQYRLRKSDLEWADVPVPGSEAEVAKLQGSWLLRSASLAGKPPVVPRVITVLVFKGTKHRFDSAGEEQRWEPFRIHANTSPTGIDGRYGRAGTLTGLGVYEVKGDKLELCMAADGGARPRSLQCTAGAKETSFVLQRFTDRERAQTDAEFKKFEGTWIVQATTRDGVDYPKGVGLEFAFKGNTIVQYDPKEGRVHDVDTFDINIFSTPKQIDILRNYHDKVPNDAKDTDERKKLNKSPGIYEFEGDSLKLCFAETRMDERPVTLTSQKGTDQWSTVLKRSEEHRQ